MDLTTLSSMPSVKIVMTPFPYFVEIGDSLGQAQDMAKSHGVHHIPVQEHGVLLGILDWDEQERQLGPNDVDLENTPVTSASLSDAYVVDLTVPLDRVLGEMAARRLRSALVTKREKLVGVFSATDACQALASILQSRFPSPEGEAA